MMMTFGSLFAGIGGFDLGLERAGMVPVWQVEIDPFCRKVLAKHWPDVKRFEDVRNVGRNELGAVDLICGGWPCQPFSVAGKRRGKEDDRHLWPEVRRIIAECRPRWFLGENVPGIIGMELDTVLFDLEAEGYTAWPFVIPACAVDAPHRRSRVWIVAHADEGNSGRWADEQERGEKGRVTADGNRPHVPHAEGTGLANGIPYAGSAGERIAGPEQAYRWEPEPRLGGMASRVSRWLDEPDIPRITRGQPDRVNRLKALGNSVVPQVVEQIGRMIMAAEMA